MLWLTDSQNLVSFMTKGSMKSHIQSEVYELFKLCRGINITIRPWHLSRDDPRIQLADEGSRIQDKDSWEVELETLTRLEEEWGPTRIDLFADYFNRKKRKFVSQVAYGNPEFVDAFSREWSKLGRIYMCPPIPMIPAVVKRLEEERRARGILLVPAWKTEYFWPYIMCRSVLNPRFREGRQVHSRVQAREWARPFMKGQKEFLAISF